MQYLISLILISCTIFVKSQSVGYQYDANGNRTQRTYIGLRINPNLPGKDSTKAMEENRLIAMKYGLSVYPNPTRDVVYINLNQANENSNYENKNANLTLMDISGKVIAQKTYSGSDCLFDLGTQPPGNYYIRVVFTKKEQVVFKVVKVN